MNLGFRFSMNALTASLKAAKDRFEPLIENLLTGLNQKEDWKVMVTNLG